MTIITLDDQNSLENNILISKSDQLHTSKNGFLQYVKKVQSFPMLTAEEEYEYGVRFAKDGDKEAGKFLIQSHLRLVVKMASKFKNYGLPMIDLVSEGNLGLIQALKKFNPQKGFRFSTYAMWWIRAYMQDYILKSWSLVKIGTTLAQKKLFFNLHKIKKKLNATSDNALSPENLKIISDSLNVTQKEIIDMDSRLSQSDSSLNKIVGDEDDGKEASEFLTSNDPSQEEIVISNQEKSQQKKLFSMAFAKLNDREKDIIIKRQLSENSMTLEDLSQIYKVSRERIRQLEENAIKKIKKEISKIDNRSFAQAS